MSESQSRDGKPSVDRQRGRAGDAMRRIETQIHRRKKAKAVPPMESEWEDAQQGQPSQLRTPPDKMKRRS